jgi:2,4-dienoyl-CoA reductase-like NADH-dependent reductase (Old Yellow Enzyme family)
MAHGLLERGGDITQRAIDYYAVRAKGGTGLIVTAATLVSRAIEYSPNITGLWGMLDAKDESGHVPPVSRGSPPL